MKYEFVVLGQPVGKGRPKFSNMGNFVRAYTPDKTTNYENLVKIAFQCNENCKHLGDAPLGVKIVAFFQTPKSLSKKKQAMAESGELRPCTKPDVDNIVKIVLDALNGIAYDDDRQVVKLSFNKFYSTEPRVVIEIEQLDLSEVITL